MSPVNLPSMLARCPSTRTVPCNRADSCARALVSHTIGRPSQDYSIEPRAPDGGCNFHLRADSYRPSQQVVGPTTHEAPKGLR